MAGKKRKPVTNPARGFATTSVASKTAVEKSSATTSRQPETIELDKEPPSDAIDGAKVSEVRRSDAATGDRSLDQLSPEELEAQLELSELQDFVTTQGPIVCRDSARHVARLQADRRVLRGQAETLYASEWLPDRLVEEIVEQLRVNPPNSNSTSSASRPSREDQLLRLWKLYLILQDLGIDEAHTLQALQHALSTTSAQESANSPWGLNAALQWLATSCPDTSLPEYDAVKTPVIDTEDHVAAEVAPPKKVALAGRAANIVSTEESSTPNPTIPPEIDDVHVTDSESDLEPDEMLQSYLKTKAILYQRNPALISEVPFKGAPMPRRGPTPGEARLQARIKSLEGDMLFDRKLADSLWRDKKRGIQDRQRLGLADGMTSSGNGMKSRTKPGPENSAEDKLEMPQIKALALQQLPSTSRPTDPSSKAEEIARDLQETAGASDEELFVGMFDIPVNQGLPEPSASAAQGRVMKRHFGKLTGMSARKILEDACKSRDSGASLKTRLISETSYNSQHQVVVSWSKPQTDIEATMDLPGFSVRSSTRTTVIDMTGISAPDVNQSEACASTAMLFLLFSKSTKDRQLAMRLPASLRDLWHEFAAARQTVSDAKDRHIVKNLKNMIEAQSTEDEGDDIIFRSGFRERNQAASGVNTPNGTRRETTVAEDPELVELWQRECSSPAYQRMLSARKNLPMYQFKDVALATIRENQVTILCGETGCGKSTQMPAFILEHELSNGRPCHIYCTEPRRISAISLAQRVSEELGEGRNAVGTVRSLVGYAIRLESQTSATTKLVYATVGIVLRMLESEQGLSRITHLIIDEVHERSIDTDFLLIVLQALIVRRPDLRVVLMSATVDAEKFSRYLGNAPVISVPGRTFPVRSFFLEDVLERTGYIPDNSDAKMVDSDDDIDEADRNAKPGQGPALQGYSQRTLRVLSSFDEYRVDYGLIVRLLEFVAHDKSMLDFSKAILVFLPGMAEIRRINDMLCGHPAFSRGWKVYPLHSDFSSEEQQAAFEYPPAGVRKIVLATNIAETGVTIPDVTCVIDTGKHKEMRFDERRQLSRLIQSFISRANAKQRRGRAGRVQEGVCFHLFTRSRHDNIMADQQMPEILRLSLQDLVMRVKICKLGDIEHVLGSALDPPAPKNIRRAIDALVEVNALTSGEELTPLGRQLAKLPLDAQLGKLILLGSVFGCLDFALTTAAISSSKSFFTAPIGAKRQADSVRLGFRRGDSDLLTAYNAYSAWRRVCTTTGHYEFQYCKKNFLSPQNLGNVEDLKGQLLAALVDAGFVSLSSEERHALSRIRGGGSSHHRTRAFVAVPGTKNAADLNDLLINSVMAWAFYPKILSREGNGWRSISNNASISLHPTSVNKMSSTATLDQVRFLSYYSIMQSSSRFTSARETSPVADLPLVLLAGDAVFNLYAGVVILDGNRLRFKLRDWKTLIALQALRKKMLDILGKTMKNPGLVLTDQQRWWWDLFSGIFERVNEARHARQVALKRAI